jgi:hypothetical protein
MKNDYVGNACSTPFCKDADIMYRAVENVCFAKLIISSSLSGVPCVPRHACYSVLHVS